MRVSNLVGIIRPILTGPTADVTGAFVRAFWITAAVTLAGAAIWAIIVPTIGPLGWGGEAFTD